MFTTVLTQTGVLTIIDAMLCTGASMILGFFAALVYMYKETYTKSFVITLTLLPMLIQIVIMMVNGNLGTGIAVMGAFSLVRFRSIPGSSREIFSIFFVMAIGLATGMGYITFAISITFIVGSLQFMLNATKYGERSVTDKILRITIPESLDYTEIFDDLFKEYTTKADLEHAKTTNLGSLYELRYQIVLRNIHKEKEFIDALRCRNGNLPILCGKHSTLRDQL